MNVSLCLFTMNELAGCRKSVPKLPADFCEIFAVDASSTDGTQQFLESCGVKVITQEERGYNGAYKTALRHFSGDAIVFFHPKGTIDPNSLQDAIRLLENGAQIVIANRNMRGGSNEEDIRFLRPRKWFVKALSLACRLRWSPSWNFAITTDVLHGYRGFTGEFAQGLHLKESASLTADLEIVRHAYLSGIAIHDFPVLESTRESGTTNFPAFKTGRKLLWFLILNGRSVAKAHEAA